MEEALRTISNEIKAPLAIAKAPSFLIVNF